MAGQSSGLHKGKVLHLAGKSAGLDTGKVPVLYLAD